VIATVPTDIPVTIPEEEPALATAGLLVIHVPPVMVFPSEVVPPTHTVVLPVIGATGLTVSVVVV
jgi:hypothetical protein